MQEKFENSVLNFFLLLTNQKTENVPIGKRRLTDQNYKITYSYFKITHQKYVSILVVSTASWDLDHFSFLEKFPGGANQVHGAP